MFYVKKVFAMAIKYVPDLIMLTIIISFKLKLVNVVLKFEKGDCIVI